MKLSMNNIPIGIKIFGLMIGMLALLLISSYANYTRVQEVSYDLVGISDHLVPLDGVVAKIQTHTLKQQAQNERIWRLHEYETPDTKQIEEAQQEFESLGQLTEKEIQEASHLLDTALERAQNKQEIIELARLQLLLQNIGSERLEFQEVAIEMHGHLKQKEKEIAFQSQDILEQEEDDIDREIETVRLTLESMVQRSARTAEIHEKSAMQLNMILVGIATIFGLLCAAFAAAGLTRPIKRLLGGTEEIVQNNLDVEVRATSQDEIGELTDIFNTMVRGIRDKERIQATFGQYLDPRIVDQLIHDSENDLGKEDKKTVTVLFSDVAHFSAISEMLTPTGLVNLINHYLTLATEPIIRSNGIIDKFIGDAVAAFWAPPYANENELAHLACEAALEQFDQLDKLRRRMPDLMGFRQGLPEVNIRVGLATGEVLVGNIGSESTKSYTILGPAAEIAEELEGASKVYGTQILMTEETHQSAQEGFETRKIDKLILNTQQTPTPIFELLSRKGDLEPNIAEMRDTFEAGLDQYWNREWDRAYKHFETCLALAPSDGPANLYKTRVQQFQTTPPPSNWDGTWK